MTGALLTSHCMCHILLTAKRIAKDCNIWIETLCHGNWMAQTVPSSLYNGNYGLPWSWFDMAFTYSSLVALRSMTKLLSWSFVAVVFKIESPMSLCFDLLLVWTAGWKN